MLSKITGLGLIILPLLSYAVVPDCQIIAQSHSDVLPLEKITEYVQTFVFEQSGVPALMIGIISKNESAVISCGETVINNGQRPKMDTVWPIGSVSKVFTTQMLVAMTIKGQVKLTTSIDDLLDNNNQSADPITLLDLATHSSGFPRQLPTIKHDDDYQTNTAYDMPDFINWYKTYQAQYKPGTHYEYSNVGYGLLGQLLARQMNTDYNGLLQQLISKPLKMSDTTVKLSDDQAKREVTSYWMNGDQIKKDWEFRFEQPSGGLYSTMSDMLLFTDYQLGHAADSKENIRLAHASYIYQNQFDNPAGFGEDAMALGWSVEFPAHGLPLQLMKNGWVNGVNTYVQLSPTEDIGIVSFTSKPYLNINSDLKKIIGMIITARSEPPVKH